MAEVADSVRGEEERDRESAARCAARRVRDVAEWVQRQGTGARQMNGTVQTTRCFPGVDGAPRPPLYARPRGPPAAPRVAALEARHTLHQRRHAPAASPRPRGGHRGGEEGGGDGRSLQARAHSRPRPRRGGSRRGGFGYRGPPVQQGRTPSACKEGRLDAGRRGGDDSGPPMAHSRPRCAPSTDDCPRGSRYIPPARTLQPIDDDSRGRLSSVGLQARRAGAPPGAALRHRQHCMHASTGRHRLTSREPIHTNPHDSGWR